MPAPSRTLDSLRHQFEVEKDLAIRLRASSREQRTELFKTLYTELFQRVPDHPRLTRVDEAAYQSKVANTQLNLLRPALGSAKVVVEFAPGDCHLARALAPHVQRVFGVDISDQRSPGEVFPENLELLVYDGFSLPMPAGSADVVFSYQFLEHLHPDDIDHHFHLASALLKPGGVYIFDTPHRHSGPHDIARYFGNKLVCLHMQEWTYAELRRAVRRHGFGETYAYRFGMPMRSRWQNALNDLAESVIGFLPPSLRRRAAQRAFPSVTMMAVKPHEAR
jgi:SAM-dependent methyltransferase